MLLFIALTGLASLCGPVVVSEVMYHPFASAAPDEYVEIINLSDSTMDLRGWSLADLSYQYPDTFCGNRFLLEPGNFAIIFEADYDTLTGNYRDILPPGTLVLTVDDNAIGNGLSNSGDTLFLINHIGDTLDFVGWGEDMPPGYSLEKVIQDTCFFAENWRQSEVLHGTPGLPNSVIHRIYDLSLNQAEWLLMEYPNQFRITTTVGNIGLFPMGGVITLNGMENVRFTAIPVMEDMQISFLWIAPEETLGLIPVEICLSVPEDYNAANDCLSIELPVSAPPRSVVINEIMYHPLLGEPEWVELVNTTTSVVQLKDWTLGDQSSEAAFVSNTLNPGDYAVVTGETADQNSWPDNIFTICLSGFPAFNNTGDEVRLCDATSLTMDEVDYSRFSPVPPGRSLERINPSAPSNESTSWVVSPAAGGHTAGISNSMLHEASQPGIILEPNPIQINTPNSQLILQYTTPYPAVNLLAEIYDLAGRRIGTIVHQGPYPGAGVLTWDASNLDPFRFKTGQYILMFQARNVQSGQKWEQMKRLIIVN